LVHNAWNMVVTGPAAGIWLASAIRTEKAKHTSCHSCSQTSIPTLFFFFVAAERTLRLVAQQRCRYVNNGSSPHCRERIYVVGHKDLDAIQNVQVPGHFSRQIQE